MALKSQITQLVLDVFCLGLVWVADILTSGLKTVRRGFFCDDSSIRYPYRQSTLSSKEFGAIFLCGPVLLIVIVEIIRFRLAQRGDSIAIRNRSPGTVTILGRIRIPGIIFELSHLFGVFLFGLGCSMLVKDVTKHWVGRLRPYFVDICQPDVPTAASCKPGFYYEDFHCLGSNDELIRDSRLSFPSGHASFAAYTMVYVVLYLQARMTWKMSKFLRPLLQAAALLAALYAGLLRISDNQHHWSDVLAGYAIGAMAAILTALYVSHLFGGVGEPRKVSAGDHKGTPLTTPITEPEIDGVETLP